MSEDAANLLAQIVALEDWYPDGWVPEQELWEAADLSYDEYVLAAEELVELGLAESKANASDFRFLRATSEGKERVISA